MCESRTSKSSIGQEADERLQSLRARVTVAQAGERRALALLESMASLMGLSDSTAVLRGIAENAVKHVALPEVRVYQIDHDAGVLLEAARVQLDARDGEMPAAGLTPFCHVEVDGEPIAMRLENRLGAFALGGRTELIETLGQPGGGGPAGSLLFQMRAGPGPNTGAQGVLVGVIAASWTETPTGAEIRLLRSLTAVGAAAVEVACIEEFRSHVISGVSHELRTPLAGIRAYNELLLDEDAGEINDEQRLFLQRIEKTCLQLDRMIEDLLDLSQLRAGEIIARRGPVDVVSVLEHIIDTLSPEAAKRSITLSDHIVDEPPLISSNADRLAQVLFNLVGNAVKYSHEGGSVVVRVRVSPSRAGREPLHRADEAANGVAEDGACLLVEVIDSGPGIASDELDRIFDDFYRGRLTERTTKGSGLGLPIASRLTRLLGGVLEVESVEGAGATFSLIFPIEEDEESN